MNHPLVIDVSRWDRADVDGDDIYEVYPNYDLFKLNGVISVYIRASIAAVRDPAFDEHLRRARAAELIPGAYHAWSSTADTYNQVAKFIEVAGEKVNYYVVDIEDCYEGVSVDKRSSRAKLVVEGIAATGVPTAIYTGMWWINEYMPIGWEWMLKYPLILAEYPYSSGVIPCTWDEFNRLWLPEKKIPSCLSEELLPGQTKNFIWQFSGDKFILPGCPPKVKMDLNYLMISEAEFLTWCKLVVPPFVEKTDPEKVKIMWGQFVKEHPELA
jgi:hypothetical protein